MGKFIYDGQIRVDFEDRVLAHLQVVITTKLRRSESFTFMWKDDNSIGNGRTMVWLHESSSLVYKFYGSRTPQLNRAWLEVLTRAANSPSGLYVIPEPAESSNGEQARDEAGIDIMYGGHQYSIGGRNFEDLKREIEDGIAADGPRWLVVNDGEGHLRPAHLLLDRGIDISVIPIPDEAV